MNEDIASAFRLFNESVAFCVIEPLDFALFFLCHDFNYLLGYADQRALRLPVWFSWGGLSQQNNFLSPIIHGVVGLFCNGLRQSMARKIVRRAYYLTLILLSRVQMNFS